MLHESVGAWRFNDFFGQNFLFVRVLIFFCFFLLKISGYFVTSPNGHISLRPLAIATSVTWLRPAESRYLLHLVDEAMRRGFIMLGTNLHYAFLITPLECSKFVSDPEGRLETKCIGFCRDSAKQAVLARVFGFDNFHVFETLVQSRRLTPEDRNKLVKLYCGLVICDMIDEKELFEVAEKYGMEVKDVEHLMESASVQASQLQSFLELLGVEYRGLAAAIGEFIPRLERGIKVEGKVWILVVLKIWFLLFCKA